MEKRAPGHADGGGQCTEDILSKQLQHHWMILVDDGKSILYPKNFFLDEVEDLIFGHGVGGINKQNHTSDSSAMIPGCVGMTWGLARTTMVGSPTMLGPCLSPQFLRHCSRETVLQERPDEYKHLLCYGDLSGAAESKSCKRLNYAICNQLPQSFFELAPVARCSLLGKCLFPLKNENNNEL